MIAEQVTERRRTLETYALALRAAAGGGRPFGAIITTFDDRVLAEAMNDSHLLGGQHAEINALRALDHGTYKSGVILYCSSEPCAKCAEAIAKSPLVSVKFGLPFRNLPWISSSERSYRCTDILRPDQQVTGPLLAELGRAIVAVAT